jgi:hypothetical protein
MAATIPEQHCNAKDLDQEQRKSIALNSLKKQDSIIAIAKRHNVSRKFVYKQKAKACKAIKQAYQPANDKVEPVLFNLPVY